MSIREQQREKRRQDILMAGLALFTRKGYAATKVSDIAERVGMSTGLMFHYFESKEKLYEALIRLGISGPMSTMAVTYEQPLTFFEQSARCILDYIHSEPAMADMFVLMGQAFYNDAAPDSVKELLRGFDIYTPTAQLIRAGQANGTIREGDPRALAIAFWCAVQGIAEELAVHPDAPCPDSDWIVDIIRRREAE